MRHPLSSVHETFCKLVHYQNRETCIGAGRLILGADRLILDLKTRFFLKRVNAQREDLLEAKG